MISLVVSPDYGQMICFVVVLKAEPCCIWDHFKLTPRELPTLVKPPIDSQLKTRTVFHVFPIESQAWRNLQTNFNFVRKFVLNCVQVETKLTHDRFYNIYIVLILLIVFYLNLCFCLFSKHQKAVSCVVQFVWVLLVGFVGVIEAD